MYNDSYRYIRKRIESQDDCFMKKRILFGIIALLMVFSLCSTKMEANAQTTEDGNGGSIQFVEISNEEMEAATIDSMSANVVERAYNGDTYSFANSVSVCSETEDEMTNTDPNYAYLVTNDVIEQRTIDANAGAYALLSGVYEPAAVHYYSSTKPAMQVSSRPALMLTFYDDSNFYRIHCTGSVAYSMNTLWEDLNLVTVLIDPDTGKLIDIVEFNYYYDFAPVGTNYITWTRSYTMTYYDN